MVELARALESDGADLTAIRAPWRGTTLSPIDRQAPEPGGPYAGALGAALRAALAPRLEAEQAAERERRERLRVAV